MKALRFNETQWPMGRDSLVSHRYDCKQRPWYRAELWKKHHDDWDGSKYLVFRWETDAENPSGHWQLIGTSVSWSQARRMIRESCKKDDERLLERLKAELDRIERGLTPTNYTFSSFVLPVHANEGDEQAVSF